MASLNSPHVSRKNVDYFGAVAIRAKRLTPPRSSVRHFLATTYNGLRSTEIIPESTGQKAQTLSRVAKPTIESAAILWEKTNFEVCNEPNSGLSAIPH